MSKAALQYLQRCVAQDKDTWINIHHRVILGNGKSDIYPGAAHLTIRTALRDAMYWMNHGHDVYLAQGAYLNAGDQRQGVPYPNALRHFSNLTVCKNLYMDVDVKEGAFASTHDAAVAMTEFVHNAKIPQPTIIVMSGSGGFHCYWTLDELITPEEHKKLSGQLVSAAIENGIHFDTQCTNDSCRLLRIPDTWNYKLGGGDLARPVTLLKDTGKDINIDEMRSALAPFKVYVTPKSYNRNAPSDSEPDDNDDLALPKNYIPLTIDEVAADCPFVRDTLADGGRTHNEPIWKHTINIACHTADPTDAAHRLSKGHPDYTPEGTDAKLAVTQQAHAERNIGPPMCATLARDAIPQCPNCPHLALNTTPLAVPYKKPGGSAYTRSGMGAQAANFQNTGLKNDLPPGYYRDKLHRIFREVKLKEGGLDAIMVFEYPLLPNSGYIEKGAPYRLTFETIQAGKQVAKTFDMPSLSDPFTLNRVFTGEAMPIVGDIKQTKVFVVNYLQQLTQSAATLITAPPFGWWQNGNKDWGFAFDGTFTSPSGSHKCTRPGAGGEQYGAIGDIQPWRALADIVLTPDRPDLCCIAAASFGAPLVCMSGQEGVVNGLWTNESGVGKTTALRLNQSVWGSPLLGGLDDTVNYVFGKSAMLRHLPINHDEIKGPKQIQNFADIVIKLTTGGEKGRSDRLGGPREKREFTTNCNYAANGSVISAVADRDRGTDASYLRMLEMRGLSSSLLTHRVSDIGRMTADLKVNYGNCGRIYADYIGKNYAMLKLEVAKLQARLDNKLNPLQQERFWMVAIATTLMGAQVANVLGLAKFPIPEMFDFMVGEYRHLKVQLGFTSNDYTRDSALIAVLGAFLNERRERGTVVLDKTWTKQGRPPKNYAKVVNEHQSKQWQRIDVQISGDPLTLKISDSGFGEWCTRTDHPKASILNAMLNKLNARMMGGKIGSGSLRAGVIENVWTISPIVGSILEPSLEEYVSMYGLVP